MNYKGMTVNERLYASGLMVEFDKALELQDIVSVKKILEQVDLDNESIEFISSTLISNKEQKSIFGICRVFNKLLKLIKRSFNH